MLDNLCWFTYVFLVKNRRGVLEHWSVGVLDLKHMT
jgi:hypothetical protein